MHPQAVHSGGPLSTDADAALCRTRHNDLCTQRGLWIILVDNRVLNRDLTNPADGHSRSAGRYLRTHRRSTVAVLKRRAGLMRADGLRCALYDSAG